jgi:hypothetical protein
VGTVQYHAGVATKVKYWYYTIERAAVLPGGQKQCAGGYSSYRGNTQIHILVAIAGHAADWNAGSCRAAAQSGGSETVA